MKQIEAILIGAGQRGMDSYASYALKHPDAIKFVAVAEPDKERRKKFQQLHDIKADMCFDSWEKVFEGQRLADCLIICTGDNYHFQPAMKALECGYNVLLEKPMSTDPYECYQLGLHAKKYDKVFSICHVLRYTDFFVQLKNILDSGRIGNVISIVHNENVAYWHQAHSYVRGNWSNSDLSSPMILAKSSHDMDILLWLAGADCKRISSFGSLTHFKKENAPEGAPLRCLDGCPAEQECPYYAPKIYLTENIEWPTSAISNDTSFEARIKALKEGPYGRCVYHCDNNVVDHQVVNMEFENEVTAAFSMCAFTNDCSRTIKIMGTKGEIKGAFEKNEIQILDFSTGSSEVITLKASNFGHGGGEYKLMKDFITLIQNSGTGEGRTSATKSVQGHLMAFAAEKSRIEKKIIELDKYLEELINSKYYTYDKVNSERK